MKQLRFLHTSDWQIGMTRWFLSGEAQARFDDARLAAIRRMGDLAEEHDCAFIVVAGDVFESNSLHPQTLGRALDALKSLPVPVYLLPGNHDPLTADSIFHRTESIENVHVIASSAPISVGDGVEIVGAPLLSKRATTDLVGSALSQLEPSDTLRIMVGHGQVASRGDVRPDLIDLDTIEAALADGRIAYVALGDTHSTESLGTTGAVWFSGAPEVTDFLDHASQSGGENNSGNALIVDIGESLTVSPVKVGSWTFEALDEELNSSEDVDAFLARLRAYPDKSVVAIKYGLQGTLDLESMQALEAGLAELEHVFASLKPRDRRMELVVAPTEDDLANLDITGYARAALKELMESEDPAADTAVRLMFRLAQGV